MGKQLLYMGSIFVGSLAIDEYVIHIHQDAYIQQVGEQPIHATLKVIQHVLKTKCHSIKLKYAIAPIPFHCVKLANVGHSSQLNPYTQIGFKCITAVLTYVLTVVECSPEIQVDVTFTTRQAGSNLVHQCCLGNNSLNSHCRYCRAHCVTAALWVHTWN